MRYSYIPLHRNIGMLYQLAELPIRGREYMNNSWKNYATVSEAVLDDWPCKSPQGLILVYLRQ